jgi:hypothetical protein
MFDETGKLAGVGVGGLNVITKWRGVICYSFTHMSAALYLFTTNIPQLYQI